MLRLSGTIATGTSPDPSKGGELRASVVSSFGTIGGFRVATDMAADLRALEVLRNKSARLAIKAKRDATIEIKKQMFIS